MVPEIGPEDRAGAGLRYPCRREGGRADEGGGLENRLRGDPYVGSNPTPPAPARDHPDRPTTNQTPCTASSPRFQSRWGVVESNAMESPGASSWRSNPSWTPRRPDRT